MFEVNPYKNSNYSNMNAQALKEKVDKNSTGIAIGAGASAAGFAAIKNSSKIGTAGLRVLTKTGQVKINQEAKLIELLTRCGKLGKYAKNPIVQKVAGGLAGLSAATVLVTDAGKIVNTASTLENMSNN